MSRLSFGLYLKERKSRMEAYKAAHRAMNALSDADLADIGAKRYQLGHMARVKALK
jgi:uncharacterized protein YjiS (DUF1127 family)